MEKLGGKESAAGRPAEEYTGADKAVTTPRAVSSHTGHDDTSSLKAGEDGSPTPVMRRLLLPILPHHEVPVGELAIDEEETRVVYLAPLLSTSKEIYFAKHRELLNGGLADDGNGGDEGHTGDTVMAKRQFLASLERRLRRVRPAQQPTSWNQQTSASVFNMSSANKLQPGSLAASATTRAQESGQIKKTKQRIRLLPITDDARTSFWETIRGYERTRAYNQQSTLARGVSTPMGFNMEAAFNAMLLEERHLLWVNAHDNRLLNTPIRKIQEDESHERRMVESSSEQRALQRLRRNIHEQLICEAQNMQPIVMLAAFTQKMLDMLRLHWARCRLDAHLRRTVWTWRHHRAAVRTNSDAAVLLIDWLQKSVAVRTVSFRIFRGLRIFVRRVKRVQGLWRKKQAVRRLNFLIIQRSWIDQETQEVDAEIEQHEHKRIEEVDQLATNKKQPKPGSHRKNGHRNIKAVERWMTFVPEQIRAQVIVDFMRRVEREFVERFREQELEFFPQLVQTLRGEHPNRARSYIRAVASRRALSGQVFETLLLYPGAVGDGVRIVEPFNVRLAPVSELIKETRSRCRSKSTASSEDSHQQRFFRATRIHKPHENGN